MKILSFFSKKSSNSLDLKNNINIQKLEKKQLEKVIGGEKKVKTVTINTSHIE
jgi:hypothetical protein